MNDGKYEIRSLLYADWFMDIKKKAESSLEMTTSLENKRGTVCHECPDFLMFKT